mgnify:CR=1 FL=1
MANQKYSKNARYYICYIKNINSVNNIIGIKVKIREKRSGGVIIANIEAIEK